MDCRNDAHDSIIDSLIKLFACYEEMRPRALTVNCRLSSDEEVS
jgi:hypothetical protein